MKTLLRCTALLALTCSPALANTDNLGTLTLPFDAGFTAGILDNVTAYEFTVKQPSIVNWSVTSTISPHKTTHLKHAKIELADNTSMVIDSQPFFITGNSWFADLGPDFVPAGTYTIEVTGAFGTAAISETGSVSAAVPEPATWATMLAGFIAMWFAGRGRQTAAIAARSGISASS